MGLVESGVMLGDLLGEILRFALLSQSGIDGCHSERSRRIPSSILSPNYCHPLIT